MGKSRRTRLRSADRGRAKIDIPSPLGPFPVECIVIGRVRRPSVTAVLALALTMPAVARAGQATVAAPPVEPPVTVWTARNWTRAEVWRFFEPPAGGGDSDYVYAANRFLGTVRRNARRYEATAALQYVQFAGFPRARSVPGRSAPVPSISHTLDVRTAARSTCVT